MSGIKITKIDLEKRTITVGGCEAAPDPVVANEANAVGLWTQHPEPAWESCEGCPNYIQCIGAVTCLREAGR
jgi:hypothetical protein